MSNTVPTTPIMASTMSSTPITPKRPVTAFIRFRRAMKKEHNISNQFQQRSMWNSLPAQEKQKYYDEYQVDLELYKQGPRATRRNTPRKSTGLQWVHMNPPVVEPVPSPFKAILPKPDLAIEWSLYLMESSNSQRISSPPVSLENMYLPFFDQ